MFFFKSHFLRTKKKTGIRNLCHLVTNRKLCKSLSTSVFIFVFMAPSKTTRGKLNPTIYITCYITYNINIYSTVFYFFLFQRSIVPILPFTGVTIGTTSSNLLLASPSTPSLFLSFVFGCCCCCWSWSCLYWSHIHFRKTSQYQQQQ